MCFRCHLALIVASAAGLPNNFHPVILSGPMLGQSLQVKNTGSEFTCGTGDLWRKFWIDDDMKNPYYAMCMLHSLKVHWDSKLNTSSSPEDISVEPLGGFKDSWLSVVSFPGLNYTGFFTLLENKGYEKQKTILVHGYDWRLCVNDWQRDSFPHLRNLVEKVVIETGSRAVLTGLSLAGPYLHSFLTYMRTTQGAEWANRHIHAFVPVGGPWNGAVMDTASVIASAVATFSSAGSCPSCAPVVHENSVSASNKHGLLSQLGDWLDEKVMALADDILNSLTRNLPVFYFASTGVDYSNGMATDPVVVNVVNGAAPKACVNDFSSECGENTTRDNWDLSSMALHQAECAECNWVYKSKECGKGFKNFGNTGWFQKQCCKRHSCAQVTYRASQLPELLRKLGRDEGASMMEYAQTVGTTGDPGVPVFCIYSHNVRSFQGLSISSLKNIEDVSVILGNGDGTVDAASLAVCKNWKSTKKVFELPNIVHGGYFNVKQVGEIIVAVATNDDKFLQDWIAPSALDITAYSDSLLNKSLAPFSLWVDQTLLL